MSSVLTKFGAKRCVCGTNIAEKMDMCDKCFLANLRTNMSTLEDELSSRTDEMFKIKSVLIALVKNPYGCPQCHSGELIKKGNDHWPDCPYNLAAPYIQ